MDGAYFRVHHFARQLASPFPLLAAVGAKTRRIEIGTAVIDMRYENLHYMAEDAGATDLIAGGRLQLGISRGSPEQVIDGWRYFGLEPHSAGLRDRIWWGSATNATAAWAAKLGMNLQTSNLYPQVRRDWRAASDSTGRPDSRVSHSLEGGWPRSHTAHFGQPQYLRLDGRPRSCLFRTRRQGRGLDRLSRRKHPSNLRT